MKTCLKEAYDLIGDKTPLKSDCGEWCGAACCGTDADGQGGVWLYPGEAENLSGAEWAEIREREAGTILLCKGMCERGTRPFGCRIFPLAPVKRADGSWTVRIDARAKAVCPLANSGLKGLDSAFVRAAAKAVARLAEDGTFEEILLKRQGEEDDFREEVNGFLGKS